MSKKQKVSHHNITMEEELKDLIDNCNQYGISQEKFNNVVQYCVFHLLPVDIIHYIDHDDDEEIKSVNKKKLKKVLDISLFKTMDLHYQYLENLIKRFCKSIYKQYPKENPYSISCSCLDYKVNNNNSIELIPNKLILWQGDEYNIVPEAREKWNEQDNNNTFMNINIPYTVQFINNNYNLEIIQDIQFASQILFHLNHFILNKTKSIDLNALFKNWIDKSSNEFNNVLDSILKDPNIQQMCNTFNKIYLKNTNI